MSSLLPTGESVRHIVSEDTYSSMYLRSITQWADYYPLESFSWRPMASHRIPRKWRLMQCFMGAHRIYMNFNLGVPLHPAESPVVSRGKSRGTSWAPMGLIIGRHMGHHGIPWDVMGTPMGRIMERPVTSHEILWEVPFEVPRAPMRLAMGVPWQPMGCPMVHRMHMYFNRRRRGVFKRGFSPHLFTEGRRYGANWHKSIPPHSSPSRYGLALIAFNITKRVRTT